MEDIDEILCNFGKIADPISTVRAMKPASSSIVRRAALEKQPIPKMSLCGAR